MIPLKNNENVDNSDPSNYPDARIKDNDGSGNGTGVNRSVYGDLHSNISRLMRLYEIVPTGLPDNETNGYQIIEALSALASKNDYIYPLTTNGTTTLSIDIKLSLMKNNEFLICLASANKTTETLIKGTGVTSMAITYSGNFKANEYVRVIKTALGVSIVRVADWNSLNAMVGELLYLKKASQSEENAGTIDTVATTPLVNKVTYTLRTIGADSVNYLATALRNGLYPKEHFAIVDGIGASPVKNVGWFSGLNIGGSGSLPVSGDITAATLTSTGPDSIITCTLQNAMADTNYVVRSFVQGESASLDTDNDITQIVFKPISTTQFQVSMREISSNPQSLKVHFEVVQL
jgi:hypothetical protein